MLPSFSQAMRPQRGRDEVDNLVPWIHWVDEMLSWVIIEAIEAIEAIGWLDKWLCEFT